MKKIEVRIHESLLKKCFPIRDRISLAMLLMHIVDGLPYASKFPLERPNTRKACIVIDKMSRLFVPVSGSLHSIHFPFTLYPNEKKTEVAYLGHSIEPIYSAFIQTILGYEDLLELSFDDMIDHVWRAFDEYKDFSEDEKTFVCQILLLLLTYEPGYLRYDYDPENANQDIHPVHHIDLFFSSKATCKIGLKQGISLDELIEILDLRKDCYYLGKAER